MTKFLVLFVSVVVSASAFAGASATSLDCKNKKGTISVKGALPSDSTDFSLTAKLGSGKDALEFTLYSKYNDKADEMDENARIAAVADLSYGVFTVFAQHTTHEAKIEVYALPKTVKTVDTESGYVATFKGKATVASDAGYDSDTVQCQSSYSTDVD